MKTATKVDDKKNNYWGELCPCFRTRGVISSQNGGLMHLRHCWVRVLYPAGKYWCPGRPKDVPL